MSLLSYPFWYSLVANFFAILSKNDNFFSYSSLTT